MPRNMRSTSNRKDNKNNLYRLSIDGGEAEPLTEFKTSVANFEWSPDGRFIAYTGTTGSYGVFRGETTYRKFPLGAVQVHTSRFIPPPGGTEPAHLLATSNPRLFIAPTSSTPHR